MSVLPIVLLTLTLRNFVNNFLKTYNIRLKDSYHSYNILNNLIIQKNLIVIVKKSDGYKNSFVY